MERCYRTIKQGDRIFIINDDTSEFRFHRRVTPNLAENEAMIKSFVAVDCPLKAACVDLDERGGGKTSSICIHLRPLQDIRGPIKCSYGGKSVDREIKALETDPPSGRRTFIGFPTSETYGLNKSHAYVVYWRD
jgi:hypothetical protein